VSSFKPMRFYGLSSVANQKARKATSVLQHWVHLSLLTASLYEG